MDLDAKTVREEALPAQSGGAPDSLIDRYLSEVEDQLARPIAVHEKSETLRGVIRDMVASRVLLKVYAVDSEEARRTAVGLRQDAASRLASMDVPATPGRRLKPISGAS